MNRIPKFTVLGHQFKLDGKNTWSVRGQVYWHTDFNKYMTNTSLGLFSSVNAALEGFR